jgi:hypothetical protein
MYELVGLFMQFRFQPLEINVDKIGYELAACVCYLEAARTEIESKLMAFEFAVTLV